MTTENKRPTEITSESLRRISRAAVHAATVGGCGVLAYGMRHLSLDLPEAYVWAISTAAAAMGLVELMAPGGGPRVLAARLAVVGGVLIGLGYYLKISEVFSRLWSLYWMVSAWISLMLANRAPALSLPPLSLILVGPPEATSAMRVQLEADVASGRPTARPRIEAELPLAEAIGWLESQSIARIDEVLIVGTPPTASERTGLVFALHGHPARLSYCMDADLPLVPLLPAQTGIMARLKRAEDIALGGVLLILSLPVLLAITVMVRLEGPGPVLFRQRRLGLGGRSFEILKFRTMVTVAADDAAVVQAKDGDWRITRVGRVLRRWSLDELPQLVNVLKGEMSLVGPRPHAFAHDVHYGAHISGYAERLRMRPGMTGLAQVRGLRGETSDLSDMERRVALDIAYVRGWSPWLDIKILLATLPALFADCGTRSSPSPTR
jgi:putative colanic acid biosynthesis UDP-glucose lipid carrier transferase